jgi:hypothetical protein
MSHLSNLIYLAFRELVSLHDHEVLDSPITDEEIKKTLFSLKDNKVPSLDGFSVGFFKKSWSIVGLDTINAIVDLSFLVAGFSSE